ncbi:MAG TPA: LysR substrate-binding domain-containing protein [Candidatus Limnocylindria bacterium]|nr:LysR substrate-binding domain-containing protein [Candidatus Limnocylindria bacterium]
MELRHLRYFVSVAEELHFTRAAEKLHIAQPALSRQIRQLEEELGAALLVRNRRQVELTAAGAAFLAEARAILERSASAVRMVQSGDHAEGGTLNIGYVWGLFHSLVPQAVQRFRLRHPEVAINLFDLTATEQAERIAAGELDAGFIGFAEEADGAGLTRKAVGQSRFVAALPEGHPAAAKKEIDLGSLRDEAFFVISPKTYPAAARFVAKACAGAGFRPKILQTAERGHTLLALVAGNCGVTLVPESLQALPHQGVVFREVRNAPRSPLYLAWRAKGASPFLPALVQAAVQQPGE